MIDGSVPWLPNGLQLPEICAVARFSRGQDGWQIYASADGGRVLVAESSLAAQWVSSGVVEGAWLSEFSFGEELYFAIHSGPGKELTPVDELKRPFTKPEGLAFAKAFKSTRALVPEVSLENAIFLERFLRLLPVKTRASNSDPEQVLGRWLTGGLGVRVSDFRSLRAVLTDWSPDELRDVVEAAGFPVPSMLEETSGGAGVQVHVIGEGDTENRSPAPFAEGRDFELPGRPELEAFFNEHVVEPVRHRDRYAAFGIEFPAPIVLHGPPGTGKTHAVQALADFLGWPVLHVDASSIGSPYIHETSRKIAEVFDLAREASPSLLIIDEMDAFLSQRDPAFGQHKVEEVAEFLRRLPGAPRDRVLVVGMTNRMDAIDSAVLRRGRFDHVLEVGPATEAEVKSMLEGVTKHLPLATDVELATVAAKLDGLPLSSVAFVVREAARLAAREGAGSIDQHLLLKAAESVCKSQRDGGPSPRIGF